MAEEAEIQKQILDYLKKSHPCHFRINTQGILHQAKGKKFIRKNPNKGMADILVHVNGKTLWIEVKCHKGKLSDEQEDFKKKLESEKIFYMVARSVDAVIEATNLLRASA